MIFDLQRYSTHDGPGIRTLVFLKGCSLACLWCQNPESRSPKPDILLDRRQCIEGCRLCSQTCPAILRDSEGIQLTRSALNAEDMERLRGLCPSEALQVCGRDETLDTLMDTILRDRPFFERSGGGVTLSGGEPFMQPDFAAALLARCKAEGLHTAVESCLHVPWHQIEPSLPYLDLVLADLKHVDKARFFNWTRGKVELPIANLKRLAEYGVPMQIRVPLIPGFNADRESIEAITDTAASLGTVQEIHFLPYHTLGMGKYALLDMPYLAPDTQLDDPDLLSFAHAYAQRQGLTPVTRG
ncbi:glycyl-radical enzyme activating protein [Aeromonas sp. sia0103]|uniref:glycyl-radical enzyme activating protein n=1 Tax=Aeromonas sp. sia0103 TaxID=2854782 RepID=UPI001C45B2B1|nr:glycyl-radical enzyme activating protein [Aeromonas sp. sia0103]MBV7598832.1 glycyl-radical enzyme activating protein [Aeromonas sp. sia0103]